MHPPRSPKDMPERPPPTYELTPSGWDNPQAALPTPLSPTNPVPTASRPVSESNSTNVQRRFLPSSVSNLRETFGRPRSSRMRLTTAERNIKELEQYAQRLEEQNRTSPSAAEAEKRIRQLRDDARVASHKAGPRRSTGIFKASCSTDLLFLMDATGSMSTYIEVAKKQVKNIVSDINRTFFNEADVRVAVVAYRDHGDKDRIEFLDFTTDVGKVFQSLDRLIAKGGDDVAEDVLGGLRQALMASWKHQTRCIMHIADAPAHGKDLHDMDRYADHYYEPRSEPHGIWYDRLIKEMVGKKINYIFFRIFDKTDRMVYKFMQVYGESSTNCKLHEKNKLHREAKSWLDGQVVRKRFKMAEANAREHMQNKMQDEGGLHFEEVQLGDSYGSLRHLVVNSVTASSSRTAVRLMTGLSSDRGRKSYQKSKVAKLGNVDEMEEVHNFQNSRVEKPELDSRKSKYSAYWPPGSDDMSTLGYSVEEDEEGGAGKEGEEMRMQEQAQAQVKRAYDIDPGDPQWNTAGWLDQTMHVRAFSPDVIDTVMAISIGYQSILDRMISSDDNICISTNDLVLHRRTKPFAQGALRLACYARTQESTNPLVVKTFKARGKRLADFTEDMRMQALCKAFALEFNSLVASESHSLDFIVVTCLQPIPSDAAESTAMAGNGSGDDDVECMSLEPMLLNGRYVKYNNNCGSVNHDNGSEVSKAAQAFSHFTFERSRGALLVADLQGVGNVLTDPAIHSRDPMRFVLTDTNLGDDGFKLFFSSHKCNSVCEKLGLLSEAGMFLEDRFAFRTDWPAATYHHNTNAPKAAATGALAVMVCCSNKLCSKMMLASTAKKTAPSFHWCDQCWPQLSSSTVKRVCANPDAYHDFEVSKFFFESQGQLMPRMCLKHGGVPGLPVMLKPKLRDLVSFRRRKARSAELLQV
ncbi:hypothetical protein SEPCBS57363_006198 [Sporothrix epigloea]|uniref:Mhck ef2 kinase domain family protein n=1 Tax=Sporothrix epigloea TaxID=1892477 RepID=A0ABP0E244_9PEZI